MSSEVRTVSVRMPPDYHEKIKLLAKKDGRPTSNFVWHELKQRVDSLAANYSDLDNAKDNTARA